MQDFETVVVENSGNRGWCQPPAILILTNKSLPPLGQCLLPHLLLHLLHSTFDDTICKLNLNTLQWALRKKKLNLTSEENIKLNFMRKAELWGFILTSYNGLNKFFATKTKYFNIYLKQRKMGKMGKVTAKLDRTS